MDDTFVVERVEYIRTDTVDNGVINSTSESIVLNTTNTISSVVVSSTGFVLQVTQEYNTPVIGGAQGPQGIPGEEDMPYSKRIDFITDNELYRGEAAVGTAESGSLWRIRKIVIGNDSDITETWAGGNANFDKVWSDRLSLSYS